MLDISTWLEKYTATVQALFHRRVWFIGLQGSYARGEARANSDIDIVLILDQLTPPDLQAYGAVLDGLPYREKVCGFVSGRGELLAWAPWDLFQFYHDTVPVYGTLDDLQEKFSLADVWQAIHNGACNLYHQCVHNAVHEKSGDGLKALYKAAAFTLEAIGYVETGMYIRQKAALLAALPAQDREILSGCFALREKAELTPAEFSGYTAALLEWASRWIRRADRGKTGCGAGRFLAQGAEQC